MQRLTLFRVWYLAIKITHYIKMLKSLQWTLSVVCRKINISLNRHFGFRKFWWSKCSSSSPLSIDMYLILFEHMWKNITQFKISSNQNCPAKIDCWWLLYTQLHYNSIVMDEIFCGYSIDDACNSDTSRASKANIIR